MAARSRWLAVVNAKIYTMDAQRPRAEALLARDGRIVHVGSGDEVRQSVPAGADCQLVDLAGRCVLPGITDSHIHFLGFGLGLERVDLSGIASLEVVLQKVREAARAAPAGAWVQGHGWDHSLWPEQRFPDKSMLDRVAPRVPIALRRKDGHMTWLSSAALEAAGITRDTPDPEGGRVGRDASGEPSGLLFERANELADRAVPPVTDGEADSAARRAMDKLHRLGVTGVHIPEGATTFRALQRLDERRTLQLRATMMLTYQGLDAAIATGLRTGFGSHRLRVGPVKLFMDGSLGSETAAMLEPFEGSQNNRGLLTLSEEEVRPAIERAAGAGLACAIHAIGDRANRLILNAYEATRGIWRTKELRQRVEHVQILHPDDVPRFAKLGVIASMQPIHATQDMLLVDRLWGQRGRYAYAFHSLLESGATLIFGSDAPVETPDPLQGLYSAITRRRATGEPSGGWYPQERITPEQALAAYTVTADAVSPFGGTAGVLAPGRVADLIALSEDVVGGELERILEARVTHTIFDGEVVYQK